MPVNERPLVFKHATVALVFTAVLFCYLRADAQGSVDPSITKAGDTVQVRNVLGSLPGRKTIDSLKTKDAAQVLTKKILESGNTGIAKTGAVLRGFKQKISTLDKRALSYDLRVESDNRYQPLPVFNTIDPGLAALNRNQKFISAINIIGNVTAWGLPLNFNYSTNRNLAYTPSALTSSLVKFDFNPVQFQTLLSSDLAQYYDLRKKVFSGMDLSGYTSKTIANKLNTVGPERKIQTSLTKYTGDPKNIEGLFGLNDAELKDSLFRIAAHDSAYVKAQLNVMPGLKGRDGLLLDRNDLQAISDDPQLVAFLTGLKGKAMSDSLAQSDLARQLAEHSDIVKNTGNNNDLLKRLAKKIATDGNASDSNTVTALLAREKLAEEKRQLMVGQADSAYQTISAIKTGLEQKGYDINKLFQMQRILNPSNGELGSSELARNYLNKTPVNGLQQLFTNVDAFKLGAFGNQLPGNVQSRDMFQTGTYLTMKSGGTPITVGYGSINDVGSVKDNSFNNSVYTSPKSFTYIGVQLRRFFDNNNLKVAVIGSYNRQGRSINQYAIPSVSDNNVALTLSKALSFKSIGRFNIDVSKSTNISSSRYIGGSEAILERQNGITYDPAADLFQSLSFGVDHRLDIRKWGFSDNIYFSYAGMGYQNPANTGLSGGKMRMGGNLRKSLYKNKLQVTLRSDLSNRAISYTSNDKWSSFQFQLDGRYLISRKFNVDLKYISNSTVKQVDHLSTPVYSLQKVQVDGNANYKIGKNFAVNHVTLAFQGYTNAYGAGTAGAGRGDMFTMSFTQSVLLKKNTLSVNVFYNKELSERKLIGNMLNSDISYQYSLFHTINLTSGVTYLDNSTIARQVGVKQGIQLFTKSSFDANAYIDIRKNLITAQYADLYAPCRAELMLRYHLK